MLECADDNGDDSPKDALDAGPRKKRICTEKSKNCRNDVRIRANLSKTLTSVVNSMSDSNNMQMMQMQQQQQQQQQLETLRQMATQRQQQFQMLMMYILPKSCQVCRLHIEVNPPRLLQVNIIRCGEKMLLPHVI